jgi:PAS domain S-box-containing protein
MPELYRSDAGELEVPEAVALRRAMRDLLALCTIPAAWVGREPDAIAKGVVDVLVTALRAECGYLSLSGNESEVRAIKGSLPEKVLEALMAKCGEDLPRATIVHELPEQYRAAMVSIRVGAKAGVIAAVSRRLDFATETESILVSVASNQAAVSLEEAYLLQERTRAERALRESEAFNRTIIETSPDCIKVLSTEGMLLYLNAGGQKMLECQPDELVGRCWTNFWQGSDHEAAVRAFEAAKKGATAHMQGYCPTTKGTPKWWDVIITPLFDSAHEQKIERLLCISRDVTAQRQAQQALEEAARLEGQLRAEADAERVRLMEIIEQAPAAMGLMAGPEHRWTYVNDFYVRITGRNSRAQFIGKTLEESLPEIELPVYRSLLDEVYRTGNAYSGREMKVTLKRAELSPEAYFDFVYQPVRDSSGKTEGILVHAVDVTDKVLARKTIAESEERLRLAQSAAQIGTWQWDLLNDTRSLSPELHEMFGTQPTDPDSAVVWAKRVHPDDWDQVQRLMQEGYTQCAMEFEYRYRNPELGWRWFYCKGRRREGESRMLGVVQDVTPRKVAEQAMRESEEELRVLQRVGATLASQLELKKLVQVVTDAGRELSQAEFGAFFYNDTDRTGEKYLLYTLSGAPPEAFSRYAMPRNTAVFGPTFRGEGTVRVADILQDPRYGKNPPYNGMPAGHLPVRSYLAVPVVSRSGEVIGGLFYGHSRVGVFSDRAERLVEGLAAQAAIAIDNARLFESARSERVRAEESRAQLRAIIETTPECVKVVAPDGKLLDMNSVGLSLVGADCMADVVGKNVYDVIAPEDRERYREFNERVCSGEQGTLEFDIVGLKGVRRHMQTHAAPLQQENGQTVHLAVTRDITEWKLAEEVLRRSEAEFRALANAVPQLVWMANPDGWIFWYNERWYEYTGKTPEQMEGWGWQSVHDPAFLPAVLDGWKRSIATGEPFEMTFPIRGADGVFRPFLTRVVPVRDPQGKITRWFGTNTDVSVEVSAREELRRNEERLRTALLASQRLAAIVDSSDDAIISKDLRGVVTSWNACAERMFGYKAEEMIGRAITTIIPVELHEDEQRILGAIARGESIEHFETIRLKKNGEHIEVSLTISPVKDEHGMVIGAAKIARDITQRKRTERALQLTEKLASVGRLAATVAHELNNPLEAITNFIYLAQTTENLPPVAVEYLTLADRELERVSHIAQQTLGFYRDTASIGRVDIRDSLNDVLRVFDSKLRYKSITTEIAFDRELQIEALGGEVRQVFANLISNAIDASPNAGTIKVHAKAVRKRGESFAQVTFADHGYGIPEPLKKNIFNPFFTTKSDVGTGLGLWVTKSLVEKHGGHIAFRSKQLQGTAFTVQFPLRAVAHQKDQQRATA